MSWRFRGGVFLTVINSLLEFFIARKRDTL